MFGAGMDFSFSFLTITVAIIKLFMLILVGYYMYNKKIIDEKFTDTLSQVLVKVLLPALIIAKTTHHFDFDVYRHWWIMPICGIVFSLVGMGIGTFVFKLVREEKPFREFICSTGFQNSGYLPMNLILFSFSQTIADKLLIYMFLFLMGFNLFVWSFVPCFFNGKTRSDFKIKMLFSPPVLATVFSLIWIAVFGKNSLPDIFTDPIRQLGGAAFPVSMIVLGAYLCKYKAFLPDGKRIISFGILCKLIIFPLIVLPVLLFLPIDNFIKFFLFLQSTMPTAVSLVIIGSYTGADNQYLSSIVFYTHLFCIISIPGWLGIYRILCM